MLLGGRGAGGRVGRTRLPAKPRVMACVDPDGLSTDLPSAAVGPALRPCSEGEVNCRCYQGIHASGRRLCRVSQTRSGPEPPNYDRGTRTRNLPACTWSLLSEMAKIIPCIFRIMVARRRTLQRSASLLRPRYFPLSPSGSPSASGEPTDIARVSSSPAQSRGGRLSDGNRLLQSVRHALRWRLCWIGHDPGKFRLLQSARPAPRWRLRWMGRPAKFRACIERLPRNSQHGWANPGTTSRERCWSGVRRYGSGRP